MLVWNALTSEVEQTNCLVLTKRIASVAICSQVREQQVLSGALSFRFPFFVRSKTRPN